MSAPTKMTRHRPSSPTEGPTNTSTLAVANERLPEAVDHAQAKGTLVEFLLASPLPGVELDLERRRDGPRDLDL